MIWLLSLLMLLLLHHQSEQCGNASLARELQQAAKVAACVQEAIMVFPDIKGARVSWEVVPRTARVSNCADSSDEEQ